MKKDFHLLDLHVCVLDSFVVCKVENSGNAVKLLTAVVLPGCFPL